MTEAADMNEHQNPLTKPKFIISAVILAIIVALGLILALLPKGGATADPTAPPSQESAAAHTQPGPSTSASVCGLAAGDQSRPATAPADTKWELVGKVATPTSPRKYGPGTTADNGLRSCFAHSPTGALYAAANVTALSATGKAKLVFDYLAVPSPERDALLKQADPTSGSGPTAQIAGYQVRSYSPDRAVIVIAAKADNGVFVSVPVPLQWYGGDWKVIVPATGSTGGAQIPDLSGYIPWSGV